MATINIRRDVADPFYRYKMERLLSKIEGKGNGIKTVIVNLSSVAQSLSRPASYVIKYFGFELGAQTNNNPADDRWIINGAHEASKLQDHLDGFIKRFVLCQQCKNPETVVEIKDGNISLDCKACGVRSNVDLRLKLSGYILKNQPKKGKKDKAAKKAARKERASKEQANGDDGKGSQGDSNSDNGAGGDNDDGGDVEIDGGSDDELTKRIKAEAKEIDVDGTAAADNDSWAVDVSEEAVKARAKDLPSDLQRSLVIGGGAADLDDDDDENEGAGSSSYDVLGTWISDTAAEKGGIDALDDVDIYLKAKELGIETKRHTLEVLARTLFDDSITKQIPKRAAMLKKMITSEKHERAFLGGTEAFLGKDRPQLIPTTSAILMVYYQEELVNEETLKKWGTKASKKYVDLATSKKVRKSAEKFIEWLETAESDDEDEESDEE